jgi:hypothetical protein
MHHFHGPGLILALLIVGVIIAAVPRAPATRAPRSGRRATDL